MSQSPKPLDMTLGGCPKCHAALQIGPSLIGKRLLCRRCRSALTIAGVDGILKVMLVKPAGGEPKVASEPRARPSGNSAVVTLLMLALPLISGCSGCEKKPIKPPPSSKSIVRTKVPEPVEHEPADNKSEPSRNDTEEQTPDAEVASNDAEPASSPPEQEPPAATSGDKKFNGNGTTVQSRPSGSPNGGSRSPTSKKSTGTSNRTKGPRVAPAAALRKGREAFERSQGKSAANDHQGAYRDAAEAWETLNQCESDEACRELASRILGQLDGLAEKANRKAKAAGGLSGKTLIEK